MVTEKRKEKIRHVLEQKQPDLTVVLENVHDPHNTSAVLRTCDAVGILDVHIVMTVPPAEYMLGRRSSASAKKWLDVYKWESVKQCFDQLRNEGKLILASSLQNGAPEIYERDLCAPVALVFGNEHAGISQEVFSSCDGLFHIPQAGMIPSLNISVACAVTLYEAYRQRREEGCYDAPRMGSRILENKYREWIEKAKRK